MTLAFGVLDIQACTSRHLNVPSAHEDAVHLVEGQLGGLGLLELDKCESLGIGEIQAVVKRNTDSGKSQ